MLKVSAFILVLTVWVFYSEPSLARGELSTSYHQDKGTAILTISASICADNPECTVATLTCGGHTPFSLQLSGYDNGAVGRGLLLNGLLVTLKNNANVLPMSPWLIQFQELDGDWGITFFALEGNARMWLGALDFDNDIVINNNWKDFPLPRKDEDLLHLKSFAKFCSEPVR